MNRFLAGLPGEERARIAALTERVTDFLDGWAHPYRVLRPARFPAVALAMAATAPWLPLEDLCDLATIPTWIYGIDEALDLRWLPPGRRRACARHYAALAAGAPPGPREEPLAAALVDMRARLERRALWPALRACWAGASRALLDGMVFECEAGERLRAGGGAPALTAYVRHGAYSIGVPLYLAGAWIVAGDPEAPRHLPALLRMARVAGRAVRLANDLRTHAKERAEANSNLLLLLARRGGGGEHRRADRANGDGGEAGAGAAPAGADADADAAARVGRWAAACVRHLRRLEAALPGAPAAARLVVRATCFGVDFYAEHDFHEVPRQRIHAV